MARFGKPPELWFPPAALLLLAVGFICIRPTDAPPVWFDEGWALTVARTWVEAGHYGTLLNGEPDTASLLNTGFPVIGGIALSFKLFGVGILQGRLFGILCTIGALVCAYLISRRLHGPVVSAGALFALLCMSTISVPSIGKQAMGEMPLVFFTLAGFTFFFRWWTGSRLWLAPTILFWGLALACKLQLFPFLALSLAGAAVWAFSQRQSRAGYRLSFALFLTVGVYLLTRMLQEWLQQDRIMSEKGVYLVTAIAPYASARITAFWGIILIALPTLLGVLHEMWRPPRKTDWNDGAEAARILILLLTTGWIAWYLLLSNGWQRYLYPPVFFGSIFLARMLHEFSGGFDLRLTVRRGALAAGLRHLDKTNATALVALLVVGMGMASTVKALHRSLSDGPDGSLQALARHLNTQTPADALIESYDWEVLFLLDRPYHYPPGSVQIELYHRALKGERMEVDYDPLGANPYCIVIADSTRFWGLYDRLMETAQFRLEKKFGQYGVYVSSKSVLQVPGGFPP